MNLYKRQQNKWKNTNDEPCSNPVCDSEPAPEAEICSNNNSIVEDEEPPPPYTPQINLPPNQADLGFTTYGEKSNLKYKTYQALDYDGNTTDIKLYLVSKISFEALR